MRRVGLILLGVFAMLCIIISAGWLWLFQTGGGRDFIVSRIEQAASSPDRTLRIGGLDGSPPRALRLTDVAVADSSGEWLTIDELRLTWKPLALIRKKVEVDSLIIDGGAYLRAPVRSQTDENEPDAPFRLPQALPDVRLGELEINNFSAMLNDEPIRLDGGGSLAMGGDEIMARLNLTGEENRDAIDITAEIHPYDDEYYVDASIFGQANGLLANLSGLNEDFLIEAKSDPDKNNTNIDLAIRADSIGVLTGAVENIGTGDDVADLNLTFEPGSRFDIDELQGPINLIGQARRLDEGYALDITTLTTTIGEIAGKINYEASGAGEQIISADLKTVFSPDYRPDIQELAGKELILSGAYQPGDDVADISLTAETPLISLSAPSLLLAAGNVLSGDIAMTFRENENAPAPLSLGGDVKTAMILDPSAGDVQFSNLVLGLADGSAFSGRADITNQFSAIDTSLAIDVTPDLIANFTSAVTPQGRIAGTIDVNGALDAFNVSGSLRTPNIQLSQRTAPPHNITFSASNLPDLRSASLRGVSEVNPNSRFEVNARPAPDGAIAIPVINFRNDAFVVTGDGVYDANEQGLIIDLRYEGEKGAEPWPGIFVNGVATLSGSVSAGNQATNNLEFFAEDIELSDTNLLSIRGRVTGAGNLSRIDLRVNEIFRNEQFFADNLAGVLTIDLSSPNAITAETFSMRILGNRLVLATPAELDFSDGLRLSETAINYGRQGVIEIGGVYANDQITADINLESVQLPQYDALITANLLVDTTADRVAAGELSLFSLLDESETPLIASDILWDGEELLISNKDDEAYTKLNLTAPLRLQRTPAFSVSASGPISGSLKSDGAIEDYAIFLPDALQALEGKMDVDIELSGTVNDPRLGGTAALTDGRFTEFNTGLSIVDIDLRAEGRTGPNARNLTISGDARGAGTAEEKTIFFDGELSADENLSYQLTTTFRDAVFAAHPVQSVTADGPIEINGAGNEVSVTGDINIKELSAEIITPETTGLVDIEVVAYNETEEEEDREDTNSNIDLNLDLAVSADNRVFIRGRGLESEWGANVTISEADNQPIIVGRMTLDRGWLDFSGRRFDLSRGQITFDRLDPNNPLLDIRAEYDTGEGVTAIIQTSGRAKDPSIEFTSTPERPAEDVMSLVLFGKPANELSPFESVQTAQALASLGGIGPFGGSGGITGKLRQSVGLDLLNFDVDPESGGGSLTVGKYVTDDLFVSANQDTAGQTGSVQIEYDITNNISLETELEQNGEQTVSANWKIDF